MARLGWIDARVLTHTHQWVSALQGISAGPPAASLQGTDAGHLVRSSSLKSVDLEYFSKIKPLAVSLREIAALFHNMINYSPGILS